jgi:phosphatidate cytidylyltransferase
VTADPPKPRRPRSRRFDWDNLGLRIVSGLVLALAVLGAVWFFDARASLVLIAIAISLLSYEWGRMAAPAAWRRVAVAMTAALLAVLFLTFEADPSRDPAQFNGLYIDLALAAIPVGMVVSAFVSRGVTERRLDAAYGVLYVAPAAMAMMWLRETPQGAGWTVMLFCTTWAADICAFATGNALKGPKLWPRFSPNKTWSGFFGGLIGAAGAAVGVAALLMKLSLSGAALIGLLAGLATMMGDLWESMLKRRFGVKDSGDLIPGHGGLLDRVDGLMFATLVFAAARLIVHFGWAH